VILADSTVWIDLLRDSGRGREFSQLLRDGAALVATEPVLMEVLAGARSDEEYDRIRNLVTSVSWLSLDPASDFEAAAFIYSHCRSLGVTPRGMVDCLIAAVALRAECHLMSSDRDFVEMARVLPLHLI